MQRTELGKITRAEFGFGGYQDAQFGFSVTLEGKGWGVNDFIGDWSIERTDRCQWTEQDRQKNIFNAAWCLKKTLEDAKKRHVSELKGTPIEVTLDGMTLKSWRVLTEVL